MLAGFSILDDGELARLYIKLRNVEDDFKNAGSLLVLGWPGSENVIALSNDEDGMPRTYQLIGGASRNSIDLIRAPGDLDGVQDQEIEHLVFDATQLSQTSSAVQGISSSVREFFFQPFDIVYRAPNGQVRVQGKLTRVIDGIMRHAHDPTAIFEFGMSSDGKIVGLALPPVTKKVAGFVPALLSTLVSKRVATIPHNPSLDLRVIAAIGAPCRDFYLLHRNTVPQNCTLRVRLIDVGTGRGVPRARISLSPPLEDSHPQCIYRESEQRDPEWCPSNAERAGWITDSHGEAIIHLGSQNMNLERTQNLWYSGTNPRYEFGEILYELNFAYRGEI